jgi:nitrate reductase gamma subunit
MMMQILAWTAGALVVIAVAFGLVLFLMARDVDDEVRRESDRWRNDN